MATPYKDRQLSIEPALNVGDKVYFDAAAEGKLLVKKCGDCGKHHHYPRAICPHCFSSKVDWTQAKGSGTVYSFSVTRRAGPVAYCIAYVQLDEGPKMMTNIVDCDLDSVKIGQKVKVTFKKTVAGVSLPMFTPA
jgi:uncharacterized OB-fold protein